MVVELAFDFAEFDAVAAYFDLEVGTAKEFDGSVGAVTSLGSPVRYNRPVPLIQSSTNRSAVKTGRLK